MTNKKPEIWAVVPAAGSGSRMESEVPKQYLKLNGQAVVSLSVRKLLQVEQIKGVVVALSENDLRWRELDVASLPNVHTVIGGATRSESVLQALHYLSHLDGYNQPDTEVWVCVHDAARPCVRPEIINGLIQYCLANKRGAILGVPVADTIKHVVVNENAEQNFGIDKTVNREQLWLAHTPQMYLLRELKPALDYCNLDGLLVTDEASAIEHVQGVSDIVLDRRDNIKITLPEDLALAEFILQQQTRGA